MPKGPKGQKRPIDVIGNAIQVAKIATGEVEEEYEDDAGKDHAAAELGRRRGATGLPNWWIVAHAVVTLGLVGGVSAHAQISTDGTVGPRVDLGGPEFAIG